MVRVCAVLALCALVACASAAESSSRFPRQYFGGKPEKPRPFEPANNYLPPVTGYPPSGTRPSQTYNEGPAQPSQPEYNQPSETPYQPQTDTPYQPSYKPSQPTQPSYQPSYQPSPSTPDYQPSQQPSQPSGYPSTGYSPSPTYQPPKNTGYPSSQPSYVPNTLDETTTTSQGSYVASESGSSSFTSTSNSGSSSVSTSNSGSVSTSNVETSETSQVSTSEDEDRHPPHIHDITVDCGKEMMTINIEFNKPYNGLIYSQDHYKEPECVYVRENSNQEKFSFTVSLNTCGTRFYSDFENEGQAYLENVLVLQNEIGIQEVWDHIRRVRCLWEGNLKKQLVSSLSVGMLNQITSNFSGDTAMARLDIQTGKGPFAPEADGLVKIGQMMTLVVSVTGDAGFDILVRECVARDSESRNVVPLTDSNGCVIKTKVFGAFQKTRETGNTGASVIAYAYFNAFKFPDEMDLIIQCEVELCKTDCDVCPNPGSYEPKRRRRDLIHFGNRTDEPTTIVGKGLRVVFAEDLPQPTGFCLSPPAALWSGSLVFFASLMSSILVSYCWQKSRGSAKFT
ncbi:unnamed protein product [Chrysodeixis includens]|uniref:ZP domain-containing protein n=1 Tax=Chrysodeixis includens TaxID=689277 RepID=A0A9P0BPA7_CHRIL|nr:unnamed protein product [Chrysodeixis includens]